MSPFYGCIWSSGSLRARKPIRLDSFLDPRMLLTRTSKARPMECSVRLLVASVTFFDFSQISRESIFTWYAREASRFYLLSLGISVIMFVGMIGIDGEG